MPSTKEWLERVKSSANFLPRVKREIVPWSRGAMVGILSSASKLLGESLLQSVLSEFSQGNSLHVGKRIERSFVMVQP
jgi:hypothetical protein